MKRKTQLIILVIAALIALGFALYSKYEKSKNEWCYDEKYHWHKPQGDEEPLKIEHNFGEGDRCVECGYRRNDE